MANLRLVRIKASTSTLIRAQFTSNLNPLIGTGNVVITTDIPNIVNPTVQKVVISNNIINIYCRPLTPYVSYFVEFKSTESVSFNSVNGSELLLEDGITNKPLILGPADPSNFVRDNLLGYLSDNIYNLDGRNLISSIVNSHADILLKANSDIGQLKNENYLEVLISDERKIRGTGPFDRLTEEGAFEIVRVGKNATNQAIEKFIVFTDFPKYLISLQAQSVTKEVLSVGAGPGTFNNLLLTAGNTPVTKLTKVTILYGVGGSATYDIAKYGYQILEPKYDPLFASTLLTLQDNQFLLSQDAIADGLVPPTANDTISIDYEYKAVGRIIDEDSVSVSQILDSIREVVPPIVNEFNLSFAPITNSLGDIGTLGDITFLDPLANPPFSTAHSAFLKEIPFRLEGLPRVAGEYAVDYESGRVFVYGADINDGTGNYPPTATYKYKKLFSSRLDYTYEPETYDLVANPLRSMIGESVSVNFLFENTLVKDVDFVANVHSEKLNERIENKLVALNALRTANSPITNVFRIYNETSGEIYTLDRFSNNTIYFKSNNPPELAEVTRERATFSDVGNEVLIVDNKFYNSSSVRIFKILLTNNRIISNTEDSIGSSFNSSVLFSRTDIFETELYFDGQVNTVSFNTDNLTIGKYQIDYTNGVIYVGVTSGQDFDLGTVNYKKPTVQPNNPHVLSVSEIYNSLSPVGRKDKTISLTSFEENEITPGSLDRTDERFLNEDQTLPYVVSNNTITVADDVKTVRHIFDLNDLFNNEVPTNFAETTTSSTNIITLNTVGVEKKYVTTIASGLLVTVPTISTGIEIGSVVSVIRLSDNTELWDSSGMFSGYVITLSGFGSPVAGEEVLVIYNVVLNGSATPIVDYNRGDFFVDYTYLADEILVSYEYGDNVIDFRNSSALDEGAEYYVTYKVGALRDALLKNFGSLVNIPIINNFDELLEREVYRDILQAALQSFTKGPTLNSMSLLISKISHIDPEIKEAIFDFWSLGSSYLFAQDVNWTGDLELVASKFDNGIKITNSDETITFPVSSNFRLEEGTLEFWAVPDWDGLDNDATITISNLTKNGIELAAENIFIGPTSYNPTIVDGSFSINKNDAITPVGLPPKIFTTPGVFIYYNDDENQWRFLVKDVPYGSFDVNVYSGSLTSSGEFYDVKFINGLGEPNDVLRSYLNKIDFTFNIDLYDNTYLFGPDGYDGYNDGYVDGYSFDGISFMSDNEHYLFDFAETSTKNRFSIYKDGQGYLNFVVYNRGNKIKNNKISRFVVSADISNWKAGESHHIATSWNLNTPERRDEMHLFIDGAEVYNIMRYGGKPVTATTDRFRIVNPEIVVGSITAPIIRGNDLNTVISSAVVTSDSIDFAAAGILPGHTIEIFEVGFGTFTVLSVLANSLTLTTPAPATLSDASFSVNPFSAVVTSEIDIASNVAVSIISNGTETEIPGLRADLPYYTVSKGSSNENILKVLGDAAIGDQIAIRTLGLNHRRSKERHYVWGDVSSVIKTQLPPPINLNEAKITPILMPLIAIGPSNATLLVDTFTATGLSAYQPSNSTEGRRLNVRVTGGNVDFTTAATVTINGTTFAGPTFEVLSFSAAEEQITTNKFLTISSVDVVVTSIDNTKNAFSVEIKEAFSITEADGNTVAAVIKFSYKTSSGSNLTGDGSDTVSDDFSVFTDSDVGNTLIISSPGSVAGSYVITERVDANTIKLSPTPPSSFSGGVYEIYNVSIGRSGFQNGFFTLETIGSTAVPFALKQGVYEIDYAAYLEVPFAPVENQIAYIGSDYSGNKQASAVIDEFRILSKKLTDVRVGESVVESQDYITTDFNSLTPFIKDKFTLMLLHFDDFPLINDSDYYKSNTKEYIQGADSVNTNFNTSVVINESPLILNNEGILSTTSEGSIEFWVSPKFDTYNDPNFRFYFDATTATVENVDSITKGTVKTSGRISSVLSVRLATDTDNTGIDYFVGGKVESDLQTITLGRALPGQTTAVKISYIPSGFNGDRISIYKDLDGFLSFTVRALNVDYKVSIPIFWSRDSWHKILATYRFNSKNNKDEIRLFVDGEERGVLLFGSGLLFGPYAVFGQGVAGFGKSRIIADINFNDSINQVFIGSDFLSKNNAFARIDNLKISNKIKPTVSVAGQDKDISYVTNKELALPLVEDAFTTYLMNFDTFIEKNEDFAIVRDEQFGIFNFTLNIIDSFGIITGDNRVDQILRTLISSLKPAQSKVTINLIE